MEIWSKCDICGRDIPVGELCYGLKKGNCICKYCCTGFENCTFTLAPAPTLTPPNEWVSVEERLPEDESRQYIEDDLDGIGYLYPCLLTYKSPNTERIHVVRFYYDIIQKWFVNNGEKLCEKGRCIAWMPLPAPYDRRPPEGEGNA